MMRKAHTFSVFFLRLKMQHFSTSIGGNKQASAQDKQMSNLNATMATKFFRVLTFSRQSCPMDLGSTRTSNTIEFGWLM